MDMILNKRLLKLDGAKRLFSICLLLSAAKAACIVVQAIGLGGAVVRLWGGGALPQVVPALAMFAAGFVSLAALGQFEDWLSCKFSSSVVDGLRARFIDAAIDGGPALVMDAGTTAVVSELVDGSVDVEDYLSKAFPKAADMIVIPLALLVALLALDWVSGLIALVCLPFIVVFMRLIGLTSKDESAKRLGLFERLANTFANTASGVSTLAAFGAVERFSSRVFKASEQFREATMKTLRVAMLSSAVLDLFATMGLAAVAIMLGFRLVEGSVEFFPALACLIMVPEFFKPIREFGSNYHASLNGLTSLEAMEKFIGRAASPKFHESPTWPSGLSCGNSLSLETLKEGPVAVVGPSGSGKTTFLNAVSGFTDPGKGFRFVVDGNSFDTLRCPEWLSRVAYIPQRPHVFNATLRENLSFYNPCASDSQIVEALGSVGLEGLVESLPDGLDTMLGEGEASLSGGQVRRVALCRAFLDERRDIWVLDEPTAHLDAASAEEVKCAISHVTQGRVAFIATHDRQWAESLGHVIEVSGMEAGSDQVARQGEGGLQQAKAGVSL